MLPTYSVTPYLISYSLLIHLLPIYSVTPYLFSYSLLIQLLVDGGDFVEPAWGLKQFSGAGAFGGAY